MSFPKPALPAAMLIAATLLALTPLLRAGDDELAAMQKPLPKFTAHDPLDKVLADLSDACGLKIEIDWAAITATGVDKNATVSFTAPKASVEQLLEMTLSRAAAKERPLAWYLDGKVVRVSTQDRVMSRHTLAALDLPTTQPSDPKKPTRGPLGRDYNFDNTRLADVITFFRDTTKANLDVNWKSLEESGITHDTPVTVQVKGVTPARALDLVTDQLSGGKDRLARVYWVLNEGVVTIATGNALNNDLVTRVYDVQDLLVVVPNFKGPQLDLSTLGNNTNNSNNTGNNASGGLFNNNQSSNSSADNDADNTNMPQQRAKLRDSLVAAIKASIGDDMWKPDGRGSISMLNGKMLVTQTLLGFKLMDLSGRKR